MEVATPVSTTAGRKSEADRPIREVVGLLPDEDALDAAVGDLLVKDFERPDRPRRRSSPASSAG